MNETIQGRPGSPITARAVCIGLFASLLVNLAMPYNDHYLYNTLMIGNHFPGVAIVLMLVLVLVVNVGLGRAFGVRGLSAGELLLVWSMIGVAGGICSAGVMRYLPTWLVVPAYYDQPGNEYPEYVLKYLPRWLLVSHDAESPAVKWFMEGMPRGESIPWAEWILPMSVWIAFMLMMYASNYALVAMFFRQWAARERLVFAVTQLPLLLAESPAPADGSEPAAPGGGLNAFLKNRLTWLGFAIPVAIWGVNGLRSYFAEIPAIPTSFPLWGLFSERPWSEFWLHDAKVFFTAIGLTYLLTTEVSFSLWFFYILFRLSFVYVAWLGAGATGFWGEWNTKITMFDTAGVLIAIAAFLFWTARGYFREWWRRVGSGAIDIELDPLPPRWTLLLLAGGVGGMIGWVMLSGAQWWAAAVMILFFLVTCLVLTRLVAEAGIFFVHSSLTTYDMMTGVFPAGWFSGFSLNAIVMHRAMLTDLREIFMPYVMNGLKVADAVRMRLGGVLAVFALSALVSLGSSAYSRIVTSYKYGALNMDTWATIHSVNWYVPAAVKYQKNPPAYEMAGPGDAKVLPVNLAHVLTGGGLAAVLLFLRAKFLWWPLHPFGLVMCTTWCMMNMWFSFFLGWAAKTGVMTFGGATAFRRLLPFFLGLVLGESVIAVAWMILGLVTGTPGLYILPG